MRQCEGLEASVQALVALLSQHGIGLDLPAGLSTTDFSASTSCMQMEGHHSMGLVPVSSPYSPHDRSGMILAGVNGRKKLAGDEELVDDAPALSRTATSSSNQYRSPVEPRLPPTQQHHTELACAREADDQTITETHGDFLGGSVRLSELDPVTVGMEFVLT